MSNNVDIFAQGNEVKASWFNPKTIGDAVQGTYVGSGDATDSYNNEQKVYRLRQENGSVINIGVKKTREMFIAQMDQIQVGQIIGIKYTDLLPPRKAGQNPTKILKIFANPSIRDEKWMKDQEVLSAMKNDDGGEVVQDEDDGQTQVNGAGGTGTTNPIEAPFPSRPLTDDEKISKISEFAKAKLGVTDPAIVREKVMEATALAFISSNLDQILSKLQSM